MRLWFSHYTVAVIDFLSGRKVLCTVNCFHHAQVHRAQCLHSAHTLTLTCVRISSLSFCARFSFFRFFPRFASFQVDKFSTSMAIIIRRLLFPDRFNKFHLLAFFIFAFRFACDAFYFIHFCYYCYCCICIIASCWAQAHSRTQL